MSQRQLNPYENVVWESTPSQWVNFGIYAKWFVWALFWLALLLALHLNEDAFTDWAHSLQALRDANFSPIPLGTGFVAGALLMAAGNSLWSYLKVKTTRFVLTTERLFTYSGVLNKQIDELELYRVKDYSQYKPFVMRLAGLGCVSVETSDRSHPIVRIDGIKDPDFLQGLLRQHGELRRNARGVRELDM